MLAQLTAAAAAGAALATAVVVGVYSRRANAASSARALSPRPSLPPPPTPPPPPPSPPPPPLLRDKSEVPDHIREAILESKVVELKAVAIADSLQRMFQQVDTDGNGLITAAEFSDFLTALGLAKMSQEALLGVIQLRGAEEVGAVSLAPASASAAAAAAAAAASLDFAQFCNAFHQSLAARGKATGAVGGGGVHPEVFLGGSCGRTTWRKAIAIPALRAAGVSYYDPQVEDWNPHLMVLENLMKVCCSTLLFVIDAETRALMSMIEAAQYIPEGRDVVLVVESLRAGTHIKSDIVSSSEAEDNNRARTYLLSIASLHQVPVFSTVREAVEHIAARRSERLAPSERPARNGVRAGLHRKRPSSLPDNVKIEDWQS
jgi:hypothetical protein